MKYEDLMTLENARIEFLKSLKLDEESIKNFKLGINKVDEEEKTRLGKELFETISKIGYNDNTNEIINLIYSGADLEYKEETKGNFALLICARKNYFSTFKTLIEAGANINQVNNYLTTATMACARHGNKAMLQILIRMGADINARCLDGDNAIMSAKRHNQVECFDMLVKASAYLNNRNMSNQNLMDIGPATFGLSQMPASILLSSKDSSYESSQDLLNEATNKLEKILKQ